VLVAYCEDALSRRTTKPGVLRHAVENAIGPLLPHGRAQVGEIARELGMSRRTLARRLASEGLTFSAVREKMRSDPADHYLGTTDLSISQVTWLLGYQETGAFANAFKRWTGRTPREMRFHQLPPEIRRR
jgi:AraC-like DNA-binding protein